MNSHVDRRVSRREWIAQDLAQVTTLPPRLPEPTAPKVRGPRGLEDLPWRMRYRVLRFLFHVLGPAQLSFGKDPLLRLEREREARYSARTPAAN